VLLWAVAVCHHRLERSAVGGTQSNVRSLAHSSTRTHESGRESLSQLLSGFIH
jgi:hypothetical protein